MLVLLLLYCMVQVAVALCVLRIVGYLVRCLNVWLQNFLYERNAFGGVCLAIIGKVCQGLMYFL
jgi:hypothetical protein